MNDDELAHQGFGFLKDIGDLVDNVRAVSGAEPTRIIIGQNQKRAVWMALHVTAPSLEIACFEGDTVGCPVQVVDADDELAVDTTPRERWSQTEWGDLS